MAGEAPSRPSLTEVSRTEFRSLDTSEATDTMTLRTGAFSYWHGPGDAVMARVAGHISTEIFTYGRSAPNVR